MPLQKKRSSENSCVLRAWMWFQERDSRAKKSEMYAGRCYKALYIFT